MRNKPKAPQRSPAVDTAQPPLSRPSSPEAGGDYLDFGLPPRVRPHGSVDWNVSSDVRTGNPTPETSHTQARLSVTQRDDLAPTQPKISQSPLQDYVQRPPANLAVDHDAAGLRLFKGRSFADVVGDNAQSDIKTVMVGFDDKMKAYRAQLPSERTPSGPPLYRIVESNTWSLQKPIDYYDTERLAFSHLPDAQGYYAVSFRDFFDRNKMHDGYGFALRDEHDKWFKVDPLEARGEASIPLKFEHLTDGDIWNMYRLRGAETLVFRDEAQASGKVPDWVRRVQEPDTFKYVTGSLRLLYPQKSAIECERLLRSYNLSVTQQVRLRKDLDIGPIPEWAEQHKRLTNSDDDRRFEQIAQELDPYIVRLRTEGELPSRDLPDVRQRYEAEFLNGYLKRAGYKQNLHGFLYRTDIPAMFRADLRTPFELARDKRLLRLRGNPSDSTTRWAFSVTFSLAGVLDYMGFGYYSNPRNYNSQANRYPGHISSDSDSPSDHRFESAGESDTSFEMDLSRDYRLLRRKQTLGFLYVIDTRGIEVVPGAENVYLNNKDFEADHMEGRLSMPTRGISAERIWLVHSNRNKAARVEDVFRQAGDDAKAIEKATWDGTDGNSVWYSGETPYDRLINRVADSGGVILHLPKGEFTLSGDVVWPVPEHSRP